MPHFWTDEITDRFDRVEDYEALEPLTYDDIHYLLGIALASRMVRAAQKQYFAETDPKKKQELLKNSKAREAELDKMLAREDGGLFS